MTSNSTTALNGAQMMSEFQDVMKTWAAAENSGAPIIQMKADFGVAKIELIKCSAAETAGITNWKVGKELDCLMAHDDNIGVSYMHAESADGRHVLRVCQSELCPAVPNHDFPQSSLGGNGRVAGPIHSPVSTSVKLQLQ